MTKLNKLTLLGLIGLSLTAASSYGNTYDFSYTITEHTLSGSSIAVTGRLDGTPTGGGIIDVTSVLNMSVGGNAVTGPIFLESFLPGIVYTEGGAVVSVDSALNDFLFINADYLKGDTSWTGDFLIVPQSIGSEASAQVRNSSINGFDMPVQANNWSLKEEVKSVPDSGLAIAMLGMGISGLAFIRRKL